MENVGEVEPVEFRLRSCPGVLASWRPVQPPPKAIGLGRRLEAPGPGAPHPGQRLVSGKAPSHGGSRERSGRGEFFTRSSMIGTTPLNLANADAVSISQPPHFTSGQSCWGYRVKKLGASPSYPPEAKPESRSDLNEGCEAPPAARGCLTAVRLSPRYPLYVPKAASLHCAASSSTSRRRRR